MDNFSVACYCRCAPTIVLRTNRPGVVDKVVQPAAHDIFWRNIDLQKEKRSSLTKIRNFGKYTAV